MLIVSTLTVKRLIVNHEVYGIVSLGSLNMCFATVTLGINFFFCALQRKKETDCYSTEHTRKSSNNDTSSSPGPLPLLSSTSTQSKISRVKQEGKDKEDLRAASDTKTDLSMDKNVENNNLLGASHYA